MRIMKGMKGRDARVGDEMSGTDMVHDIVRSWYNGQLSVYPSRDLYCPTIGTNDYGQQNGLVHWEGALNVWMPLFERSHILMVWS